MESVPAPKTTPVQAQDVFRPVLLRGLTAAIYALLSIFWVGADEKVLSYSTAAFLVVTGVFMWQYVTVDSAPEKSRGPYALGAGLMLIAGIATIFATTTMWIGILAFRNQLVTGVVGLILAAATLFGFNMDAHAMFGVIGGGAIVLAVFVLIAGFGHRHEMKATAAADGLEAGGTSNPGTDGTN